MKTITKTMVLGLLTLALNSGFAKAENESSESNVMQLRKEVISQIGFPNKIKNASGKKVKVNFEINKNCKPEITFIESDDKQITDFVKHEFENMKLSDEFAKQGEVYKMEIKFSLK